MTKLSKLQECQTFSDFARILGVKHSTLYFILYKKANNRNLLYSQKKLKKKNGSYRDIDIPISELKYIQRKLSALLAQIYLPKTCAHGFIAEKSIITNAVYHKNKRHVINIDLKDFFPSINFGRIYGLLQAKPYCLPTNTAKIIAQIATKQEVLPQGSPSSPIISNMICAKLDSEFMRFAKKHKLAYTRYADDITFSTNLATLPRELCTISDNDERKKVVLSNCIDEIISSNGFVINDEKIRYYTNMDRQTVTGLVVNDFVNVPRKFIRNTRAMLYKWEVNGITEAAKEYNEKYRRINSKTVDIDFYNALLGKINFIHQVKTSKIDNSPKKKISSVNSPKKLEYVGTQIHDRLYYKFAYLYIRDLPEIAIVTEGKTDYMHLYSAWHYGNFSQKYVFTPHYFDISNKYFPSGDTFLRGLTKNITGKRIPDFDRLTILLYDSDDKTIINEHNKNKLGYVQHTENIYSMILPESSKSKDVSGAEFCIEHLYLKKVREAYNTHGRRLFEGSDFDDDGTHKTDKKYQLKNKNDKKKRIIESAVIDNSTKKNCTLSKNDFAKAIKKKEASFSNVDFSNFEHVFDKIEEIYNDYKGKNSTPQ